MTDDDGYDWTSRRPSAGGVPIEEWKRSSSAGFDLNMPNTLSGLHVAIQSIISNDPTGLTAVWSPIRPTIDIIFVHGLGGTSGKTWCCDKDYATFWPSWLHEEPELLNARVHTFGYSASIAGPANSSGIFDFARDLLFKMKYEYVNYDRGPPIGSVSTPFLFPDRSSGSSWRLTLKVNAYSRFPLSSLRIQWGAS